MATILSLPVEILVDFIFCYMDYNDLTSLRLVSTVFESYTQQLFCKNSRLIVNETNENVFEEFMENSCLPFQNVALIDIKQDVDSPICPLLFLPTPLNELIIKNCLSLTESGLIIMCKYFEVKSISWYDVTRDQIDVAFIITELSNQNVISISIDVDSLAETYELDLQHLAKHSNITSIDISHIRAPSRSFEKSKLFNVLKIISKNLRHFGYHYKDHERLVVNYNDYIVESLSELDWNLASLAMKFQPNLQANVFARFMRKLPELKDLKVYDMFMYNTMQLQIICDSCAKLRQLYFIHNNCRKMNGLCGKLDENWIVQLQKLNYLEEFSSCGNFDGPSNPKTLEAFRQLNAHLKYINMHVTSLQSINLMAAIVDRLVNLTVLKIVLDTRNQYREWIAYIFENLVFLETLHLDLKLEKEVENYCDDYDFDVRNLTKLKNIDIGRGHSYMQPWITFQKLSQMPQLRCIKFSRYYEKIAISDVVAILRNCSKLQAIEFSRCNKFVKHTSAELDMLRAEFPAHKFSFKIGRNELRQKCF